MPGPYLFQKPLPKIENLVFQGGGDKLIAAGGLLTGLVELGMFQDIKRVAGSSAGSIVALLIALDYSPDEIKQALLTTDFRQFLDHDPGVPSCLGCIDGLFDLMSEREGYYTGRAFLNWARSKVQEKLGSRSATFSDLRKAIEANADKATQFKDLHVTGTNITQQAAEVFNSELTPDMEIATAVRISMSYPLVFESVAIDRETGKIILGEIPTDKPVEFYADGGMRRNDPASLFDAPQYFPEGYRYVEENPATLNFRVDSSRELKTVLWNIHVPGGVSLSSYFNVLSSDALAARNHALNTVQSWNNNFGTFDFNMSREDRLKLMVDAKNVLHQWYINTRVDAVYRESSFKTGYDILFDNELLEQDKVNLLRSLIAEGVFTDDSKLCELVTQYVSAYEAREGVAYGALRAAMTAQLQQQAVTTHLLRQVTSRFEDSHERIFKCISKLDETIDDFAAKVRGYMERYLSPVCSDGEAREVNAFYEELMTLVERRKQMAILAHSSDPTFDATVLAKAKILCAEVAERHHTLMHPVTEARRFLMGVKQHIASNPWGQEVHVQTTTIELENGACLTVPKSVGMQWDAIAAAERSLNWLRGEAQVKSIARDAMKVRFGLPETTQRYYRLFQSGDAEDRFIKVERTAAAVRPNMTSP